MFFLFILSHGSEQGIIWTDTKIGDVFDRFTNDDVLMALKENIFLKNTFKLIFFGVYKIPLHDISVVTKFYCFNSIAM